MFCWEERSGLSYRKQNSNQRTLFIVIYVCTHKVHITDIAVLTVGVHYCIRVAKFFMRFTVFKIARRGNAYHFPQSALEAESWKVPGWFCSPCAWKENINQMLLLNSSQLWIFSDVRDGADCFISPPGIAWTPAWWFANGCVYKKLVTLNKCYLQYNRSSV